MRKLALATTLALLSSSAFATTINYTNFDDLSDFTLNGATAGINTGGTGVIGTTGNRVLRLTNTTSQSGSAFLTDAITLTPEVSFSTFFEIQATDQQGGGADGIVFTVQTNSNNTGGSGGGIGYQGIPNSVGIEFDNWNNGSWDDHSANHVGIDINGSVDSVVQSNAIPTIDAGGIIRAWVDYNGATDSLEVRVSSSIVRPTLATLTYNVDLTAVLGTPNAFIGFTSGTGAAGADHDILRWVFQSDYNPIIDPENVPEPTSVLLLGLGLLGLGLRRKV